MHDAMDFIALNYAACRLTPSAAEAPAQPLDRWYTENLNHSKTNILWRWNRFQIEWLNAVCMRSMGSILLTNFERMNATEAILHTEKYLRNFSSKFCIVESVSQWSLLSGLCVFFMLFNDHLSALSSHGKKGILASHSWLVVLVLSTETKWHHDWEWKLSAAAQYKKYLTTHQLAPYRLTHSKHSRIWAKIMQILLCVWWRLGDSTIDLLSLDDVTPTRLSHEYHKVRTIHLTAGLPNHSQPECAPFSIHGNLTASCIS